jgi:uncharacterized repeat protein (TIGR03803 family)
VEQFLSLSDGRRRRSRDRVRVDGTQAGEDGDAVAGKGPGTTPPKQPRLGWATPEVLRLGHPPMSCSFDTRGLQAYFMHDKICNTTAVGCGEGRSESNFFCSPLWLVTSSFLVSDVMFRPMSSTAKQNTLGPHGDVTHTLARRPAPKFNEEMSGARIPPTFRSATSKSPRLNQERRITMATVRQCRIKASRNTLGNTFAFLLCCVICLLGASVVQAQTFTVIHDFTGGGDGANPISLTIDQHDNLYGATNTGGLDGAGNVFRLRQVQSSWVLAPLYSFNCGVGESCQPGGVTVGSNGTLFGTTGFGGSSGVGTVFNLRPSPQAPRSVLQGWLETVIYSFGAAPDGNVPNGNLVFDQVGDIYGITYLGGAGDGGTVFELTPAQGGGWTESILYSFDQYTEPSSGLVVDQLGHLYGTTYHGGQGNCMVGCGTVFELIPSGSGWTEEILYFFEDGADGRYPDAGLIFDNSGNLYGTTFAGGNGDSGGGTVFKLTPSNGQWTFTLLYSFSNPSGTGSAASLTMDSSGDIYGTTTYDGANGYGSVFKLTNSNGSWTYSSLHDFTGGTDGANPYSSVVFDTNGNLYGAALHGGNNGAGVVFEIQPPFSNLASHK